MVESNLPNWTIDRREFLRLSAAGLGGVALSGMAGAEAADPAGAITGLGCSRTAHPSAAALLSLFPGDGQNSNDGKTTLTPEFASSGSKWTQTADEKDVFQYLMQHKGRPEHDWAIRIGKGGMIYSFIGSFGESVPPQRPESVWNDEVWQLVAVNNGLQRRAREAAGDDRALREKLRSFFYFAHQSGTYNRDSDFDGTFYSPLLAERADPETRSYASLNWIQQAHVPSVWQSHLYCYQRMRNVGDGVIELTYLLYNGGAEAINHMNVPWGGVRHSSLPHILVSKTSGGWEGRDNDIYGEASSMTQARNTAGWIGWSSADKADSPSLMLVHGRDLPDEPPTVELDGATLSHKTSRRAVVRWGTAIKYKPERDYSVATMSWKPVVEPGQTVFFRSYFVVGPRDQAIEKAAELAPNAGGGLLHFDAERVPRVALEPDNPDGPHAYAWPIANAKPILLLRDTETQKLIVTTDPYLLVEGEDIENPMPKDHPQHGLYDGKKIYRPYRSPVEYVALLGFFKHVDAANNKTHRLPLKLATAWGEAEVAEDALI